MSGELKSIVNLFIIKPTVCSLMINFCDKYIIAFEIHNKTNCNIKLFNN